MESSNTSPASLDRTPPVQTTVDTSSDEEIVLANQILIAKIVKSPNVRVSQADASMSPGTQFYDITDTDDVEMSVEVYENTLQMDVADNLVLVLSLFKKLTTVGDPQTR